MAALFAKEPPSGLLASFEAAADDTSERVGAMGCDHALTRVDAVPDAPLEPVPLRVSQDSQDVRCLCTATGTGGEA